MFKINHINFPDPNGKVYCYAQNKIVSFNDVFVKCSKCKYFNGTAQGRGIECLWEDTKAKTDIVNVFFPKTEYKRVNK